MRRRYAAVTLGVIAFCLAYGAADYLRLTRPLYDPLGRAWLLAAHAPPGVPIVMGFYGLLAWGLVSGCVGALLGAWLGDRLLRRPGAAVLLGGWALMAVLLVGAYFTHANWP